MPKQLLLLLVQKDVMLLLPISLVHLKSRRCFSVIVIHVSLISKDGVTVAKSIDFSNPLENVGAQLVRSVASKTNDQAGDGS